MSPTMALVCGIMVVLVCFGARNAGFAAGVAASQPEIELLQEMVERGCG